jgi:hypothetical protein
MRSQVSQGVAKGVVDDDMNDNDGNVDDRVSKKEVLDEFVYLTCFRYLMVR